MKKWFAIIGVIVLTLVVVFFNDIRKFHALYNYAAIFDPAHIDENFRTLYMQNPSITVKRGNDIYALPRSAEPVTLPATFQFEGQAVNTNDWLLRSDTTGMAILHGGQLVYEYYDRGNDENSHAIMMSVSKSIVSMLIGVAVDEGIIDSVDDAVVKYAKSLTGSAYDDGVTIKDVLQMSSGVRWTENYGELDTDLVQSVVATLIGSLDEFTAQVPRENPPGTYNRYASIDTQALGMILRGATRKSFADYFHEKLWSQIGAEHDAYLLVDAVGEPMVYGGINISLRDMLRFGQLYNNGGKNYLGKQLVSANWVQQSTMPMDDHTQPGVDNPQSDSGFGYGYQWWLPLDYRGDYVAIGMYGQFIYIDPANDVVIAKTSAYADYMVDGDAMIYEATVAFQAISEHMNKTE